MTATTVVVPTYNEAGNVAELVRRLGAVAGPAGIAEVIFVDDSSDHTPQVIAAVAAAAAVPVRLIHRPAAERHGGLSGAVVAGLAAAGTPWAVVMDGDLQHPPEDVPRLMAATGSADLVVASRYTGGGSAGGLAGRFRRFVSTRFTRTAKLVFPRRLGACTDPMTGFFAVRRDAVDLRSLRPQGFKILLEILVRHPLRVTEVPFAFAARQAEASKARWTHAVRLTHQLGRLRWDVWRGTGRQLASFATIGAVNVVLDVALFTALVLATGMPLTSKLAASVVAIGASYAMNARWTWPDAVRGRLRSRLPMFALLSLAGTGIAELCLVVSHYLLGLDSVLADNVSANGIGLALGLAWRFWSYGRWVFGEPAPAIDSPRMNTESDHMVSPAAVDVLDGAE